MTTVTLAYPEATEATSVTLQYPAGLWDEGKRAYGGGNVASSGVPESFIQRRDRLLSIPLRWHESQHQAVLAFIEAMEDNPSQGCALYVGGSRFACYLDDPSPGERWRPTRYADWVFEYRFVFRTISGAAFNLLKF